MVVSNKYNIYLPFLLSSIKYYIYIHKSSAVYIYSKTSAGYGKSEYVIGNPNPKIAAPYLARITSF